jgi:hypothetical protein
MDKIFNIVCTYLLFCIGLYEGWNGRYDHATYAMSCACFIKIGI